MANLGDLRKLSEIKVSLAGECLFVRQGAQVEREITVRIDDTYLVVSPSKDTVCAFPSGVRQEELEELGL